MQVFVDKFRYKPTKAKAAQELAQMAQMAQQIAEAMQRSP